MTYAALQAQIRSWIDDPNIDAAECITLAESRLSRKLTGPEMETATTLTPFEGQADLPSDYREIKAIYLVASQRMRLESAPLSSVQALQSIAGIPQIYCVTGDTIQIAPSPAGEYSIGMTYRRSVPALSDANTTNWLLDKHPDLYLAAALTMAEFKGWNDSRLPLLKVWYDELIAEVNMEGNKARRAGPIRLRLPVSESAHDSVLLSVPDDYLSDDSSFLTDG